MKKIGFFGGSFNPPHAAHIMAVAYVLSCYDLDKILIVPCYRHPFQKKNVNFEDRMKMSDIAFQIFQDKVIVSDIEKKIGGVSYTIKTIEAILKEMHNTKLYLMAGSDIIKEKDKWKDFSRLNKLVDFIFLSRKRYPSTETQIPIKFPAISSRSIRKRIKEGGSVVGMVPGKVLKYIEEHGLYK